LFVLAGCNQLYGLDETIGPEPPVPVDSDKDSIADEDDNCALVPNADQANRDADIFGDACDPCADGPQSGIDDDHDGIDDSCDACPLGPNHDEDGDTLLDGCDNCPGVANVDQADVEADGVGDACDIDNAALDTRTFFEAFAPPDPMWNTGFSEWTATGEGFMPKTIVMGPSPWNRRADVIGIEWNVTALVRLPAMPPDNTSIGISTTQENGTTALAPYCTLEWVTSRWQNGITGLDAVITDPMRIRLQAVPTGIGGFKAVCWINDVKSTLSLTYPEALFHPMLYVTRGTPEYLYLDVIQTP
jgi:hypothetical protein